jgi:glycosyltransferase involved in cell wall biosynthesis
VRVSLILATVCRTWEVARFLDSLVRQSYRDWELVVVDQNPDARLKPILDAYVGCVGPIYHLRAERGLSRARNVGLGHIAGDIVGFPDDDCWYPPDLLERVVGFFELEQGTAGLCGRASDEHGRSVMGRWAPSAGPIGLSNVWYTGVSFTIFLRTEAVSAVGPFDERLGVGSGTCWGSGEETDYLIRAIKLGFKLWYDPTIAVYHPEPFEYLPLSQLARRSYRYARGMGFVIGKNAYPLWRAARLVARPLGGVAVYCALGRFRKAGISLATFAGRFLGWADGVMQGR